jgi:S1-C subfamily serine protease
MDTLRRLLFTVLIFSIASGVFAWWRQDRGGYGLIQLLQGQAPPAALTLAQVTPSTPAVDPDDVPILTRLNQESANLAAAVLPSVVSVTTRTVRQGAVSWHPFFGLVGERARVVPGLGSGAIISKDGRIITNYHVIEGVSEIMVTTNDEQRYPARILGASAERDIALLQIESDRTDFPALKFSNSDNARVGELVFAIGNPFGLSGTVTQGIISARDRRLDDSSLDYLQTDTVINPGNSGGPLVNIRGEIVGINVAIYRGDANVRAWQGVGLAVPANDAKIVIDAIEDQMRTGGSMDMQMGYLGIELSREPVVIDRSLLLPKNGALVTDIDPRSPAAAAGLQSGDVIVKLDGQTFSSPAELLSRVQRFPAGRAVKLEIIRDDRLVEVDAVLGPRPQ